MVWITRAESYVCETVKSMNGGELKNGADERI